MSHWINTFSWITLSFEPNSCYKIHLKIIARTQKEQGKEPQALTFKVCRSYTRVKLSSWNYFERNVCFIPWLVSLHFLLMSAHFGDIHRISAETTLACARSHTAPHDCIISETMLGTAYTLCQVKGTPVFQCLQLGPLSLSPVAQNRDVK